MSLASRLSIATNGFRGGNSIFVDSALKLSLEYEELEVEVETVQAIGADFGPVKVDIEIEGCY